MADNKPSFFSSVVSGIKGYFKGIVAGGVVGAITGGIVGVVIAIATANPLAIVGAAVMGGMFFAGIGAIAGTTTEVVRSRQQAYHSAADTATVADIAFSQGVAMGRNQEIADSAQRKFREAEEKRRAAEQAAQKTR